MPYKIIVYNQYLKKDNPEKTKMHVKGRESRPNGWDIDIQAKMSHEEIRKDEFEINGNTFDIQIEETHLDLNPPNRGPKPLEIMEVKLEETKMRWTGNPGRIDFEAEIKIVGVPLSEEVVRFTIDKYICRKPSTINVSIGPDNIVGVET